MTTPTIEYAHTWRPLMTVRQWLIIGVICGALPLTVGMTTALLFLITYNRNLEPVGVFVAATGLLIVAFGGMAWLIWVLRTRDFRSGRWWLTTAGAALLLLANFPACVACVYAAGYWRFTVVNQASTPMTVNLSAIGLKQTRTAGPIEPGGRKRFYWRIDPDGDEFIVTTTGAPAGPQIDYFRFLLNGTGAGADVDLTVNPDGTISVK